MVRFPVRLLSVLFVFLPRFGTAELPLRAIAYQPTPIGQDARQPSGFTAYSDASLIARDAPLIAAAGGNALRLYGALIINPTGEPFTQVTHEFLEAAEAHGVGVIMGSYVSPQIDFTIPAEQQRIIDAHVMMAQEFASHTNIVGWVVGNEVNLGIRDLQTTVVPVPEKRDRLTAWYATVDGAAAAIHAQQGGAIPWVGTVDGDDSGLFRIFESSDAASPNIDVVGANIFRGRSFGTVFEEIRTRTNKPIWVGEMGIDRYDGLEGAEDAETQGEYMRALWWELEKRTDNIMGGCAGFWTDEWWKSGLPDGSNGTPDIHDFNGYANGAFPDGFAHEEWFGICAVAKSEGGIDQVLPGASYEVLQEIWDANPDAARLRIFSHKSQLIETSWPAMLITGSIDSSTTPILQLTSNSVLLSASQHQINASDGRFRCLVPLALGSNQIVLSANCSARPEVIIESTLSVTRVTRHESSSQVIIGTDFGLVAVETLTRDVVGASAVAFGTDSVSDIIPTTMDRTMLVNRNSGLAAFDTAEGTTVLAALPSADKLARSHNSEYLYFYRRGSTFFGFSAPVGEVQLGERSYASNFHGFCVLGLNQAWIARGGFSLLGDALALSADGVGTPLTGAEGVQATLEIGSDCCATCLGDTCVFSREDTSASADGRWVAFTRTAGAQGYVDLVRAGDGIESFSVQFEGSGGDFCRDVEFDNNFPMLRLFTAHRGNGIFGSGGGIVAFEEAPGEPEGWRQLWSFPRNKVLLLTVTPDGTWIPFLASDGTSEIGEAVHFVRASNGGGKWSLDLVSPLYSIAAIREFSRGRTDTWLLN